MLTFEGTECIRVSEGQREGVPEGRGGDGKGSVPQGAILGLGDGEKVGISGAEAASGGVAMEEICYVRGCKVV